ncbi:MAG: hypothetical protein P8M04_05110 [Akkermansiaceae bacterium]|nr:hypothetical protein [Akkermansiaceae bacterium]
MPLRLTTEELVQKQGASRGKPHLCTTQLFLKDRFLGPTGADITDEVDRCIQIAK